MVWSGTDMSPVHQVRSKSCCKAHWEGEDNKADRRRGGKTTSGNGQAWSSPSPRGRWGTVKNGGNRLWSPLWCCNDHRSREDRWRWSKIRTHGSNKIPSFLLKQAQGDSRVHLFPITVSCSVWLTTSQISDRRRPKCLVVFSWPAHARRLWERFGRS